MVGPCMIRLRVKVAPWVRWYVTAVALMAYLQGREPDMDKVVYWAMKGVKVAVEPVSLIGIEA